MAFENVHSHGNVTIAGEWLQILGLCWSPLIMDECTFYLYRATPVVTQSLAFCYLIRGTTQFIRLVQQARSN
jgi:hypothetical protein